MKLFEQRIREVLVIDETSPSGLRWNQKAAMHVRGKPAGRMRSDGYWQITLDLGGKLKQFCAHRIVWLLFIGRWPKDQIDHINGDKANNRISNLREASNGENQCNQAIPKNNSSGVKGVSFAKGRGKWRAQVTHDRKQIYLGLFINIADAERAVRNAREQLHGAFANHGAHPSGKGMS